MKRFHIEKSKIDQNYEQYVSWCRQNNHPVELTRGRFRKHKFFDCDCGMCSKPQKRELTSQERRAISIKEQLD